MATHQHATVGDTVYLYFGSNKTDGDGDDGASPVWAARLAGAAAGAAAVDTGIPTLLTHTDFTAGAHEAAVVASVGNGFVAGNTYAIFVSLLVDSVNPTGFAGSFTLAPIIANITEIGGDDQSATDLKDFADAGYDPGTNKVQGVVLVDTTTTNTDKNTLAATDIVTGGAIDTTGGAVDNVTLVDTTTTNTDKNTLAATDIVTGGAIDTTGGAIDNVTLTDTVTELTTNNDKTGYSLSATGLDLVKISDLAGVIAADATLADAISFVTMAIRNAQTATSSLQTISNDAGAPIAEAILSDNGTTTTKGEYTNP